VYEEFHSATGIEIDDRKNRMSVIAERMEDGIKNTLQGNAPRLPNISILSLYFSYKRQKFSENNIYYRSRVM
jgi:hypothetical protein